MIICSYVRGDIDEYARLLLDGGADPNTKDKNGQTAFMIACSRCHDEVIDLFMKYHPNLDIVDNKHNYYL